MMDGVRAACRNRVLRPGWTAISNQTGLKNLHASGSRQQDRVSEPKQGKDLEQC